MQGGPQRPRGVLAIPKTEQWGGTFGFSVHGATCRGPHSMKEEQENSRQATQESATGQTRTAAEKGGGYRVG